MQIIPETANNIGLPAYIGRWVAVIPATLVSCAMAYVVSVIGYSLGGLTSGLVLVVSSGVAAAATVWVSAYIAPSGKRGVALTAVAAVIIFAAFLIGNSFTNTHVIPWWLAIINAIAMIIGACIVLANLSGHENEAKPDIYVPPWGRWLLCVPVGMLVWAAIAFGIGVSIGAAMRGRMPFIAEAEIRLLGGVALVATVAAVSPSYRKAVVLIAGAPFAMFGTVRVLGGIFQPLIMSWYDRTHPGTALASHEGPGWVVAIQGFAWLCAAGIPAFLVFVGDVTMRHEARS